MSCAFSIRFFSEELERNWSATRFRHSRASHFKSGIAVPRGQKRSTLKPMWKTVQPTTTSSLPASDTARRAGFTQVPESSALNAATGNNRSNIGKGLTFVGQITASEPLYIDGNIEGTINLPGERVTVGRTGNVTASINARDIVVLGTVCGNVSATDKVEIRAEGSLTGDISTARISIEEGAFFKGTLDVRQDGRSQAVSSPCN